MSILDRIRGDEDDGSTEEESGADDQGDDALFGEGGGDEFADLGDGGDDMDDMDDDLGGDLGGGGGAAATEELEQRIEELENELGSLSSTTSTVKSENEEISTTVEDIEENVRQLLEIYEMVTRGVNPFVDDVQAGGMSDADTFGVFGTGDEEDPSSQDLDDSIADAEAEDFFDDDLGDFDDAADDVNASVEREDSDLDVPTDGDGGGEGKSFEDLKQEYESGDAEWADEELDDGIPESDGTDDGFDMDATDGDVFDDAAAADTDDSGGTIDTGASSEQQESDGDLQFAENTVAGPTDAKPYLGGLPDGYVADLIVLEWLEYLLGESNRPDVVRAIRYYEAIDWIDEPAAEQLRSFLDGFGVAEDDTDGDVPAHLTIDHHVRSLEYIGQLAGDGSEHMIGRLAHGGGRHGIQR